MADKIELKEFGANLKRIREERKLTLPQLAAISELDDKQIAKIEKGQRDIRLSTVIKLLWALDVDANEVFPKK
jgi:transcriptional regulator with XRE-family HTH domain